MKKSFVNMAACALAFTVLMTGCSLTGKDDVSDKTSSADASSSEQTDTASSDSASVSDSASTDSSIVVLEDLTEPELENAESEGSGDGTENSSEAQSYDSQYHVDDDLVMVFFGDSQIANGQNDGTDIPSLVATKVPNGRSINLAIGGTTASLELNNSDVYNYEAWTAPNFYGTVLALEGTIDRNTYFANYPTTLENLNKVNPSEVDFYFIEYGANDFFGKIPLDKQTYDGDIHDLHTYYGSLALGIDKLKQLSPNAEIVLISPFYGVYYDSNGTYLGDSYTVSNGIGTLADYAKKAQNVAEDKGIYLLDCMFISKCDLYLDTADQYLMDHLHLTLTGRQIVARLLAHVPNSYRGYEPSAYRQCEFVRIAQFNPDEYFKLDEETFSTAYPEEYQKYLNGEYLLAKPE
nr:SGNH/GDSL hydrolase family protein [uncultured Butyrivibrio sp.]